MLRADHHHQSPRVALGAQRPDAGQHALLESLLILFVVLAAVGLERRHREYRSGDRHREHAEHRAGAIEREHEARQQRADERARGLDPAGHGRRPGKFVGVLGQRGDQLRLGRTAERDRRRGDDRERIGDDRRAVASIATAVAPIERACSA